MSNAYDSKPLPMLSASYHRIGAMLLAAALLTIASAHAATPLRGAPLFDRYSTSMVGAPPRFYGAAHDRDGRLYIANQNGLLRYDGDRWQLLDLPNKAAASDVASDARGRIYVGGFDLFGRVESDGEGNMQFIDLRPQRDGEDHPVAVGDVWQIISDADRMHIRTQEMLYTVDGDDRIVRRVELPDRTRLLFSTPLGLVGRIDKRGLVRVDDEGALIDIIGGKVFADQGVAAIVSLADRTLIVAERSFYVLSAAGIEIIGDRVRAEFANDRANTAIALSDGSIAVGTLNGELLRFDASLTLQERVPINNGSIEALHIDREHGLWVLGEGELVRLRLPAPWTQFNAIHQVTGTTYDVQWHDGALWFAGSAGLQRLTPNPARLPQATHLPWFDYEGYALESTSAGLLIGHRTGLLVVEGGMQWRPIVSDGEAIQWLLPIAARADRRFAVGERNVYLLAQRQGRWTILSTTTLAQVSPTAAIAGNAEGQLWLADSRGAPQRWQFDLTTGARIAQTIFGSDLGLPQPQGATVHLFDLDDRIHAVIDKQAFVFAGEQFVPFRGAPETLVESPEDLLVVDSPAGTFAMTWNELLRRAPGTQRWDRVHLAASIDRGFVAMRVGSDGAARLLTWTGVLQFDPLQNSLPKSTQTVSLAGIGARLADGRYSALPAQSDRAPAVVPAGASLELRFGLITMEPGAEFRYRVHGVTSAWSAWSDNRLLILRSPHGGDYAIEVQARTRAGGEASPLFYRFSVRPGWSEIGWLRAVLAALGLLVLAAAVQWVAWWRTQRLQIATRQLETRIAERTEQLEIANRKLAELATEDGLTGIANRRALENGLTREWHRCLDQRRPVAALMIDVDHFKRYNDEHGHLEGDIVLKQMAAILTRLHNPHRELLARFGGEEFALLLPGLHIEEAQNRALEACSAIAETQLGLTVSIGVAAQVPSPLDDPHVLLRRADAALYRAKRNGRNRVEIAND